MQNQNESDSRNQQHSSPRSLGEILEAFPLPENSMSNSSTSSKDLSTITSPMERPALIGKPLSEHGLETLRNIAQSVSNGNLLNDKMLETLLEQHFTSSRFVSKAKVDHVYDSPHGYEPMIEAYDISVDELHDSEMKWFDALEFLNRPASGTFLAKQIARLRTVMARTNESNQDLAVLVDTYADRLAMYPPDVVKTVCDKIMDNQKWFPLISEMKKDMERLMLFRRSVLRAFEECRNPLLAANKKQKQIAADPRWQIHWKELPKKDWLSVHYDWAIAECEDMLRLAEQNPAIMDIPHWQAKVAMLTSERAEKLRQSF